MSGLNDPGLGVVGYCKHGGQRQRECDVIRHNEEGGALPHTRRRP